MKVDTEKLAVITYWQLQEDEEGERSRRQWSD